MGRPETANIKPIPVLLTSLHSKAKVKKENQDNWKDELPCHHSACHQLLCTEFDEGPEGSFAFCQPWLPVQLPHLRRLPWPGTCFPSFLPFMPFISRFCCLCLSFPSQQLILLSQRCRATAAQSTQPELAGAMSTTCLPPARSTFSAAIAKLTNYNPHPRFQKYEIF